MSHYKEYKEILAQLQPKVSKEKSATLQQLNAIQTGNQAVDCLPIDSQIENDLHSKFKIIKALLRSWKILIPAALIESYQMSVHVYIFLLLFRQAALYQMSVHVYI